MSGRLLYRSDHRSKKFFHFLLFYSDNFDVYNKQMSFLCFGKFLPEKNMDDDHCSGRFRIPKRALFRASVYLVAVLGCALQSDYICQDYFRYPTTTYFSILDSPPQITPPTLTLSFPYEAKIGTTLKDLFARLNNNATVRNAEV